MPRLVDKLIRDHVRYTGDGLPNEPANAPLPVGDPSSGVHNPTKRDIREAIGDAEGDRIAAEAAAALAAQAMTDVQGATMFAASRDALLANTASNIPAGAVFATRAEGFAYEVVTTGEDATTAGGVKLRVLEVDGKRDVKAFGAKGDGATDDSAAFQAAVNAVGNGTLLVPPGTYRIHEISCTQGTMILCADANGEVSANANGTGAGRVRFVYNGTGGANSFMFRWRAGVANNWLFGGGILGRPVMHGSILCATGIQASSTVRQRFDIEMRNFIYAGVRLDSSNGVLSVACWLNLLFTYGAAVEVENCHGVVLTGEVGNSGCTQHDIKTHGLIKHGDMVRMIGNCDNNRLTILASRGGSQSGATGNALSFYDGATTHPRNNTIYDIAGPIYSSPGAFGNTIVRGTSETTKVHGPGQLHLNRMVDYVNGKMYSTPTFPLFERREIPASQGVPFGGATLGVVSGVGAGVICADGAISGAVFTIPGGNWQKGKIRRVRIKYSCATASVGTDIRFRVKVAVTPMGQGFVEDVSFPLTAPGTAAGSAAVAEIVITDAYNLDMVPDALVSLLVERIGNDALDTSTGTVTVHAVEVDYVAFGPEHSYAAPVAYPDFKPVKT
jgi:hypothetical protein